MISSSSAGDPQIYVRRAHVSDKKRHFWQAAYQYARLIGGGALDDVIQSYRGKGF